MTPDEQRGFLARRKARSVALGLVLAGLAVLFYLITIVRMEL